MTKLRYAAVGTGHRVEMYLDAILGPHADVAELVALLDPNPARLAHHASRADAVARDDAGPEAADLGDEAAGHRTEPLVTAPPEALERVIADHRIDRVIVTSPDATHAALIVRALEAGADVVVEKPLTTDAEGVQAIAEAVERTGRRVIVTFNYRYSPRNSELKRLIADGEIGRVTSIAFEWVLDTVHGADYFRRWHRDKSVSGGLAVHKSSHHFDLVSWWLDDAPRRVFASGGLRFYGDENARARGVGPRPERGTHDGERDPFSLDLRDDPRLRALYLDAERHDGYLRDRDVFDPGISIEDNLAVIADYSGGATLSYALNAHAPWEGYRVAVNGTEGRAELDVVERGAAIIGDDGRIVLDPSAVADASGGDHVRPRSERLVVQRHWETAREVPIPHGAGAHGGGDALLLSDVFRGAGDDPLGRPADWHDGVRAVAVGIATNRSLESGRPVDIADLALGVVLGGIR
ncbi:Gfo/Idh/MocA family protein [Agromyces sp. NPDC058110]|uniref:Gfo/Idh/MocA family protein n=1 Tax=Agromyces sp. NPDC058110 TaxID=3346345 RepID=UPI0036DA1355